MSNTSATCHDFADRVHDVPDHVCIFAGIVWDLRDSIKRTPNTTQDVGRSIWNLGDPNNSFADSNCYLQRSRKVSRRSTHLSCGSICGLRERVKTRRYPPAIRSQRKEWLGTESFQPTFFALITSIISARTLLSGFPRLRPTLVFTCTATATLWSGKYIMSVM